MKCISYGMTVFAGCYDLESAGAKTLNDNYSMFSRFHLIALDLESPESIKNAYDTLNNYLNEFKNKSKILNTFINNKQC